MVGGAGCEARYQCVWQTPGGCGVGAAEDEPCVATCIEQARDGANAVALHLAFDACVSCGQECAGACGAYCDAFPDAGVSCPNASDGGVDEASPSDAGQADAPSD